MLRTIGWFLVSYCVMGLIGTYIVVFGTFVKRLITLYKVHDSLEEELLNNFDEIMKEALMDTAVNCEGNRAFAILAKVIDKIPKVISVFLFWPATYWLWYNYIVPIIDEYCNERIKDYQQKKLEDV